MGRMQQYDRQEVLEKAMNLFWKKGYHDTSADDLVKHLGLSRSSIYHGFSNKHELFLQALGYYISTQSAALVEILKDLDPHPRSIRLLLEKVLDDALRGKPRRGCLVVNTITELAHTDAHVRRIAEDNIRHVLEAFRVFIAKAQQEGNIGRNKDPEALAAALFHNMTAIRVISKTVKDKALHLRNIDGIMQLFN